LSCGIDAAAGRSVCNFFSSFKLNWCIFGSGFAADLHVHHQRIILVTSSFFCICATDTAGPIRWSVYMRVLETVIAAFLCVD
jgi:hypothetical protein